MGSKMEYMQHADERVRQKILELCDALCSYERISGRCSALIIREEGGFVFRADSGKPVSDNISDAFLLRQYAR